MWGLSAYLAKKNYAVDRIQDASSQWLHFIRPDYYVAIALEKEGINPEQFGLTSESSCYIGYCDMPFSAKRASNYIGGCGGMKELILEEKG
ncbi:hypothetical protein ACFLT4_07835 [Chloroflexota bacterium]